jgi:hypothetical protein
MGLLRRSGQPRLSGRFAERPEGDETGHLFDDRGIAGWLGGIGLKRRDGDAKEQR